MAKTNNNKTYYDILWTVGMPNSFYFTPKTAYTEFLDQKRGCDERYVTSCTAIKALPIDTHLVYTVNVYRYGEFSARYTFVRHSAAVEYIEEVTELGFEATINPLYASNVEFDMLTKLDFNQEVM